MDGVRPGHGQGRAHQGQATPEIWNERAKFKERSEKLETETTKLAAAAKTGNLDSLKVVFGDAAKSCKSCHDAYRAR